jgi:peroxiredoxin
MWKVSLSLTICVAGALVINYTKSSKALAAITPAKDRKPAPDFTLQDGKGAGIKLSDYKGNVVLLNFWATWCGPCKVEIPWFIEFENKYRGAGFAVLGVAMDDDGWKSVRPYVERTKMNYRVMIGDDVLAQKFDGIDSLPQTLLIDRDGKVAARHVGLTSKSNYEEEIEQLLRK